MASNSDTSTTTRREHLQRTAGAALTVTGASTLATTSASAQTDGETDRSLSDRALIYLAAAQGKIDSQLQRQLQWLSGSQPDAETDATDAQEAFNANSEDWVAYINEYASLSGGVQVIELEFVPDPEDNPDETATRYLITDYGDEQYTSAEIVTETDREVDETVRLESIASSNAAEEIDTAYEDFVEPDEPPSDRHLSYLASKYRFGTAHVTTTLLGDELEGADQ